MCIRSCFTQTFSDLSLAGSISIPSQQMKGRGDPKPFFVRFTNFNGVQESASGKARAAIRAKCGCRTTFEVPVACPIAVSTAAADIKFPPPVKAVPDRFHPPPRPVGAGPEMLERHGEHGTAPGQHKGRAQAAELRKNDILMHQTEVASLLSHQRRCRRSSGTEIWPQKEHCISEKAHATTV